MVIRTPDQRVRVFVSSTLGELAAERQAVTAAINQLRLTPVLFELGARPYPPRDLYRAYLEQSDVFIGIYASSYGWVAPGMEISGLEDEYRLSAGKPRLIYTKQTATREDRLNRFLDMIRAEGVVSYRHFQDADELKSLVADDLAILLTERFASAAAAPATAAPAAAASAAPAPSPGPVSAPPPPTLRWPLIDRVDELKLATEMLRAPDVGLVTLTGPGGVGKTALALAAADAVAAEFADGAAFISLETLTDPALIRDTIAQQLHVPAVPGQPLRDSLLDFLAPRNLLIVVDNVEHLVSATPLAEQALERAPRLKALVTSREPLRVRGERVLSVTPFTVPEPGITVDLETLAAVPAIAFFLACAREAQPGFTLTEANATAVAEICRRLDGLALALQLAAARLTVLTPAALLARLERRLALLTRGPRDLPARQQSLRAAIAWSYDLLRPAEQRLFRQLGVFVGGFTLEMVEALTADAPDSPDPLELISTLVSESVAFARPQDDGVPRYGMLDTIREYAQEQLDSHGETARMHRRHAEMMRDLCQRAEPMLLVPAQRRYWMAQLGNARDNIQAALAWSLGADGELAIGISLAGLLGWFWLMSGRLEEAASWYGEFLARRDESDSGVAWAMVLHGSALQLWGRAELGQAAAREEPAVEVFRSAGEGRWLAYSLSLMARIRTGQGQLAEARTLLGEARVVWGTVTNTYGQPFDAYLRFYQGSAALMQGDAAAAQTLLESSLRDLEASGDEMGGVVLGSLGMLAAQRGEHAEARARFAAGLRLLRSGDDEWDLALLLLNSGLEEAAAASATAGALLAEALQVWRRLGGMAGVALSLAGLGQIEAGRGGPGRAGQLFGAGQALLPGDDPVLAVIVPYDLPAQMAAARAGGDPVLFDQGLAEGQGWTIDEAVTAGLGRAGDPGPRPG
jgi:predicted ATPase